MTTNTEQTVKDCLTVEQPAPVPEAHKQQEPVAYDKTELNCFAQDLYDQKMREGKRGHYESMFHVIHQCIKKVSPQPRKPWVGLTDEDKQIAFDDTQEGGGFWEFADAIEAKLRELNEHREKNA